MLLILYNYVSSSWVCEGIGERGVVAGVAEHFIETGLLFLAMKFAVVLGLMRF